MIKPCLVLEIRGWGFRKYWGTILFYLEHSANVYRPLELENFLSPKLSDFDTRLLCFLLERFQIIFFKFMCFFYLFMSAASVSSATTTMALRTMTERILSKGSMKPLCIHLGIVVLAWEKPSFWRM